MNPEENAGHSHGDTHSHDGIAHAHGSGHAHDHGPPTEFKGFGSILLLFALSVSFVTFSIILTLAGGISSKFRIDSLETLFYVSQNVNTSPLHYKYLYT